MTEFADEVDDSIPQSELRRLAGGACVRCGRPYTHRDAVASVALGLSQSPRCLECLASGLKKPSDDLRRDIIDYVRRRDCFGRAWREAERLDSETAGHGWPMVDQTPSHASIAYPILIADVEWTMSADVSVLDDLAPGALIRILVPVGFGADPLVQIQSCPVDIVSRNGPIIWARKRE